jgi:tight adherence protein B
MGLAILMFVVGVAVVMGGYALITKLPAALEARRMTQRLQDLSTPVVAAEGTEESLVMRARTGPLPALDKMVSESKAGSGLSRLIEQSGVRTSPSAVIVMCLGFGIAAALATNMILHVPYLPMVALVCGGAAPICYLLFAKSRRMGKFEEQFPEALDLLSRALRAGHAFQTSMGMVADDLKEPVGPEFRKTFDQQNFGLPLRDSLFQLADRIPLMDVRFFTTAVLIQRDTGGNLAEILDNLAHVVRERFRIRREIRTKTAHGRFTGLVLLALPAGLGVILTAINPDHMELLFSRPMGHTMIGGAIVMQVVGFLWIRKILDLEV